MYCRTRIDIAWLVLQAPAIKSLLYILFGSLLTLACRLINGLPNIIQPIDIIN